MFQPAVHLLPENRRGQQTDQHHGGREFRPLVRLKQLPGQRLSDGDKQATAHPLQGRQKIRLPSESLSPQASAAALNSVSSITSRRAPQRCVNQALNGTTSVRPAYSHY
jgi:hypothetical protein